MTEVILENLCRLCLKEYFPHINIFKDKSATGKVIYEVLNFVYNLEIFPDDGLPEYICLPCLWKLTEFEGYKIHVHYAKEELGGLIRKTRENTVEGDIGAGEMLIRGGDNEAGDILKREVVHSYPNVSVEAIMANVGKDKPSSQGEASATSVDVNKVTAAEGNCISQQVSIKEEPDIELLIPRKGIKIHRSIEEMGISYPTDIHGKLVVTFKKEITPLQGGEGSLSSVDSQENVLADVHTSICQEVSIKEEMDVEELMIPRQEIESYKTDSHVQFGSGSGQGFQGSRGRLDHQEHTLPQIVDTHRSLFADDSVPLHNSGYQKQHMCIICGREFPNNSKLIRHIRVHTKEKPFQCTMCDYSSAQNCDLKKHILIHTGEKPFHCNVCSYRCTQRGDLKKHILIHSGERPFKCHFCDHRSTQKGDLKRHMLTHTGEKPFQCTFCDFKSSRNNVLKMHIQSCTGRGIPKCDM